MSLQSNDRRRFITTTLALSALASIPARSLAARTFSTQQLVVSPIIQQELVRLYGDQAKDIRFTNDIKLDATDVQENTEVVPIRITAAKGLVSSLAVLVERNPKILACRCRLHEGADLDVGFRIKMVMTSPVYVVAQTRHGLIASSKLLKIVRGCNAGG